MYWKLAIAVLFFVSSALAGGENGAPRCPEGEVFKTCGGCDPGCKEPKPICPKNVCQEGCFCISGYVRNENGHCIPRRNCPTACKPGEIFRTCGGCEKSCTNLNPACSDHCKVGCFCLEDYARNSTGQCVPIEDCSPKCGTYEVYKTCGTCDKSCKEPNPVCTEECKVGCFCIDGYVRNSAGQCILAKDCPPKCGPHEFFTDCGSCNASCKDPNPFCAAVCRVGCFCEEGYVRNDEGKCIPAKDCPRKCKPCEVFSTCGTCDKTCKDRNPPCTKECKVGCFCIKGFVRHKGQCIPAKDCPPRCESGEVYRKCGRCDGTCRDPHPSCPRHCQGGCFCRGGWVRNDKGICVPLRSCRRCPKVQS